MKTVYTCDAYGKIPKARWIEHLRIMQKRDEASAFCTSAFYDEDTDTLYWEMIGDYE